MQPRQTSRSRASSSRCSSPQASPTTRSSRGARAAEGSRPKEAVGFVLEGDVYSPARRSSTEAADAYAEALEAPGRCPGSRSGCTGCSHAARQPANADAVAARWLKEHPKDAVVRLYLADLRPRTGRTTGRARKATARCSRCSRTTRSLLNNLAWTLYELKDPGGARLRGEGLQPRPQQPGDPDTLGWMLVERGTRSAASRFSRKAAGAAPNALEIRMHYAKALLKTGDKVGAHGRSSRRWRAPRTRVR